jgi:hypothetical protein
MENINKNINKNININSENISFLLEDIDTAHDLDYTDNNEDNEINKLYSLIDDDYNTNNIGIISNTKNNLLYYIEKSVFTGEDETYYNEKYTIKELMKICAYYGIDKDIKASKCRKMDIITTIVFFEAQAENVEIVSQRNNMWAYITELATDPKMRKYLLWS